MTETTNETLGEVVQKRLDELGWSNAELARRTGFSSTHIGNLIRDMSPGSKTGKPTRIPASTVDTIARALGVSIGRLRRAAGLAAPDHAAPFPEVEQIVELMMEIPREKRLDVLAMVAALHARYASAEEPSESHVAIEALPR